MTERHLILTVSWPDARGGVHTSTSEALIGSDGTRQQEYHAAMDRIRVDGKIPEGVRPNTLFFSLEPNACGRRWP